MVQTDRPVHTRLRGVVAPLFTAPILAAQTDFLMIFSPFRLDRAHHDRLARCRATTPSSGTNPVNRVTIVIWSNLTTDLDGQRTANTLLTRVVGQVYDLPS